ncbi:MAG TPA: leucyl aminopeptidase [Magnetospirillaceae bacterium]|jgi:leucyl aminopeptidase
MKIAFAKPSIPTSGALVVGVIAGKKLSKTVEALDKTSGGLITNAMETARFDGKKDQLLSLYSPSGLGLNRLVLIGLGDPKKLDAYAVEGFGGAAIAALLTSGETDVAILAEAPQGSPLRPDKFAARVAHGAKLRAYRFDKYRTKEKKEEKPSVRELSILSSAGANAKTAYAPLDALAEGVYLTRNLASEPPNILYPESLAAEAKKLAALGVTVEVLGVKEMQKLGMGALLGVGQGSSKDSRLVVMQWKKGGAEPPIAVVGKGVTFDTGGISIKPAGGMEDMKWDMGGAGVTIGLMKALALRKAKANVIGVAGLVENMPDGNAQRPGDVVTTMSGQTVEVINTDAEGRLVLADAIWYTIDRFKPKAVIDLATLTGAIIIALGELYAGLFSNDDTLASRIIAAGETVGEPLWRMPIHDVYDKMLKSEIADMKNVSDGRGAGSSTAAMFIKRFTQDVKWAHLDIAGVTWSKKDSAVVPKGATAFGVRTLDALIAAHYEKK